MLLHTRGNDVIIQKGNLKDNLVAVQRQEEPTGKKEGDNDRRVGNELEESFYLFVSALEYHGEGAMTDQVFGVILELAYTFHRLLTSSIEGLDQDNNEVDIHQRWCDVETP